jgi:signal transduction histidine kinase
MFSLQQKSSAKLMAVVIRIAWIMSLYLAPFQLIAQSETAVLDGIAFLSVMKFNSEKPIVLDQEWEFYWGKHLDPSDFQPGQPVPGAMRLSPVVKWRHLDPQLQVGRHGYGTYRLLLKSDVRTPVTLIGHRFRNSSKLWVNGKTVAARGRIGTSFETSEPDKGLISHTFIPAEGVNEIILQVTNFHHERGGGGYQLMAGTEPQVQKWFINRIIVDAILMGSLALMGFYHIGLWLMKRRSYEKLMFAVFCLLIAGRSLVSDESWLLDFVLPDFDWRLFEKLDYISGSIAPPFLCQFLYALFPREIDRTVVRLCWAVCIAYCLDILLMPPLVFGSHLLFVQFIILLLGAWCLKGVIQAIMNRRDGAITNLMGLVLLDLAFINDLLLQNYLIRSITLLPIGVMLFVLFQAVSLSVQFQRAFDGEAKARKEFEDLSQQLEKQVEERTKTIAVIINNVQSGFFLIDAGMRILPGFTRSCNSLLGLEICVGKSFFDIFAFSERDRDGFEAGIGQIFDDVLPEAVALGNLSSRIQRKERIYEVIGSVVRDQDEKVSAMLFSVSDITELVRIEQENSKNRMLLRILDYKEAFRHFIEDVYDRCLRLREQIQESSQNLARQSLHTIKGNSTLFELKEISALVHEIEEHDPITAFDIQQIDRKFEEFLNGNFKVIGLKFEDASQEALTLHRAEVFELKQKLIQAANLSDIDAVFNSWYAKISSMPVNLLLGPIERSIHIMAEKIGKKVKFSLIGGETKVDPSRYGKLVHSLIHLIRNALDHGIEDAALRAGKDPYGEIKMSFQETEQALVVEVEDDGAGINTQKLMQSALVSGRVMSEEMRDYDTNQILSLIFQPGLSHIDRADVTQISGRGIGMTAVKQAVEALGGSIYIHTTPGVGTKFRIEVPKTSYEQISTQERKAG